MLVQLRCLEQLEPGKPQVARELLGVDRGFFIVEQRRAEMHLASLARLRVDAVHAHRLLETHTDVEELHIQLTVQLIPQRVIAVVLDRVEVLRRHGRQGRRQHLLGVLIGIAGELFGLDLQGFEVERLSLAIRRAIPRPSASGQQASGRQTGISRNGHRCFEQIPAMHKYNLS